MQLPPIMSYGHCTPYSMTFSGDPWTATGGYALSEPIHVHQACSECRSYDDRIPVPASGGPTHTMPLPPPYATPQDPAVHSPSVAMHHPWPSQILTGPSGPPDLADRSHVWRTVAPQRPLVASSATVEWTPTLTRTAPPRRKLTDDDRRLVCLEAENNPTMKQTQIGAKFNVERR